MNKELEKAIFFLENALIKYKKGLFLEGEKDRKISNEIFDKLDMESLNTENKDKILYQENLNFGLINNTIQSNINDLLKKDKNILKEYISLIKSDNILNEQYKFYYDLLDEVVYFKHKEDYVNALIEQKSYNDGDIKSSNKKLISFIRKYSINEMINFSNEDIKLYEAIDFIYRNNKTHKNIDKYKESINIVVEYLQNKPYLISNQDINSLIENVDELYKNLSSEEKKIVDSLTDITDKNEYYEKLKKEVIELINKEISKSNEQEDIEHWRDIIEKLNKDYYTDAQFNSDELFIKLVLDLEEIKKIISE